ncbi:hypothetical protein [Streptomyces griseus]|nr:hypothetical protein [Streptomyces griseus]
MTGLQVAVEGYVHEGEVAVYGVLAPINRGERRVFSRTWNEKVPREEL